MTEEIFGSSLSQIKAAASSPVHSYIFSGPPSFPLLEGLGDEAPAPLLKTAACEFAAELFAQYGQEHSDMARQGHHTNLRFIKPEGRTFRVADATAVIDELYTTPRGKFSKKIVVCEQFHTADNSVATRLLKLIEEPPDSAILILLTEDELAETIASRCLRIDFSSIPKSVIMQYLQELSVPDEHLEMLSDMAGGDLGKAYFLALNESYNRRFEIWGSIPESLQSSSMTGSAVAKQVKLVQAFLDEMVEGLSDTEEFKREKRRIRDTEIKFGLFLMQRYFHDQILGATGNDFSKVKRLSEAAYTLDRNPNENAFLADLFFDIAA